MTAITYEINANISMSNRFELPDGSVILMRTKRSNVLTLTYTGTGVFFSNGPGGVGIADFELQDIRISVFACDALNLGCGIGLSYQSPILHIRYGKSCEWVS